ncbi:UvrD-helicase domain-containing protein [Bacillaceae bacterium]
MNTTREKQDGSQWTDEQWRAITERGNDVLVAAAAGSGKTAVLVERVIRLVTDVEAPVDADRLLVVTFTNAAASEMRQRIREALEHELSRRPSSRHLRRQLLLLNQASISTIHSFCLDVVKRYSYLLDLDPGFRIADETEGQLLRQDVMEELFEEMYGTSEKNSPFFSLVEWFGSDRDDAGLQRLVERIYDFAMSHPWPGHWLDEMAAMYQVEEGGDFDSLPWAAEVKQDLQRKLEGVCHLLQTGIDLCKKPGGPLPYLEQLQKERAAVEELSQRSQGRWQGIYEAMQTEIFRRLNPCRGDGYDKALQEKVKGLRDEAKKEMAAIKEGFFRRAPAEILAELGAMAPLMQELSRLVKRFAARYARAKRARGIADFTDLEHDCLKLLLHPDSAPGRPLPSDIALQYREHFVEILVDEYQDTNPVQETILALISREDEGSRFMVGDVKQSIYRFRLTEPKLFLEKYKSYRPGGGPPGTRIDLVRNFRSRKEILAGTNYLFRQLMHEAVAEIDYDENAELKLGAKDYPCPSSYPIEVHLLDRSETEQGEQNGEGQDHEENGESVGAEGDRANGDPAKGEEVELREEAETAQLEARLIAAKIKEYVHGLGGGAPLQVYDRKAKEMRDVQYRDIVILLRSARNWAPLILEELHSQGIPAYAEESGGYFSATEIEVMLSLLRVIDNPYQDIPLAAVLRSPIVGLTAEELAQIRIAQPAGPFYEAVIHLARGKGNHRANQDGKHGQGGERNATDKQGYEDQHGLEDAWENEYRAEIPVTDSAAGSDALRGKLTRFLRRLEAWRTEARQGSLSSLIWQIYRETGYYDYVGGMPGGVQRQANLRVLYDRARKFEQTSFRGLFRFLRFVEQMQERGDDMDTARTLGEQEDVVRIMTIHKSKGLEFPVVFVAGLGKGFNLQDARERFLYHKELGFGSHFVDLQLRTSYPTLPYRAIQYRIIAETLAEEMRLLYVALTRAKEKCILVGTARDLGQRVEKWGEILTNGEWRLPAHLLTKAKSYLDWLGLALIRHPQAQPLRERFLPHASLPPAQVSQDPSQWEIYLHTADALNQVSQEEAGEHGEIWEAIRTAKAIDTGNFSHERESEREREAERQLICARLSWTYPYPLAEKYPAKRSVSELKRQWQRFAAGEDEGVSERSAAPVLTAPSFPIPAFMEQKGLTAAERGTAMHLVMQHLAIQPPMDVPQIAEQVRGMVARELLTSEQAKAVDVQAIAEFFRTELGAFYFAAERIHREIPFSLALPAEDAYPEWRAAGRPEQETVLVQGIIDCLLETKEGFMLIDYKTDRTERLSDDDLRERYREQIHLYAHAVERIWKVPLFRKVLYFFDGKRVIEM